MHVYIAIQWNTLLCRTARHCQKTCTIGGVTILEGSLVVIPIYSLHHSPEYWENPEEFEPERCDNILCFHLPFTPYLTCTFFPFVLVFSHFLHFTSFLLCTHIAHTHTHSFHPDLKAKRHPLVHMPFGWGPRNCIGSRFALMEAKMALLSTLKHYKFQRSLDTEVQCVGLYISVSIIITFFNRFRWRLDEESLLVQLMESFSKW